MGGGQPPLRLLGEDRPLIRIAGALLALLALTGCTGDDEPTAEPTASTSASPTATPTPVVPSPPPAGPHQACYLLDYDDALADSSTADPLRCREPHTAVTFFVGRLVDPDPGAAQAQVAEQCPCSWRRSSVAPPRTAD